MTVVAACVKNVHDLWTEEKFCNIRDEVVTQFDAHSRRTRCDNTLLQDYEVEKTTGNNKRNKDERGRLFYSTLNRVINEINERFSHQNTKIYAAVSALQPENSNFLDVKMVQPLLELVDCASVKAELDVAKTCVVKLNGDEKTKSTTTKGFSEHCKALKAIPTIHLVLKLGVTLAASTKKCENSFSVLKQIMRDCRQSTEHARKAHLVHLVLESNLTKTKN